MRTIATEWMNEVKGMEWQKIIMVRVVDKDNMLIDGYTEFIDTRI